MLYDRVVQSMLHLDLPDPVVEVIEEGIAPPQPNFYFSFHGVFLE